MDVLHVILTHKINRDKETRSNKRKCLIIVSLSFQNTYSDKKNLKTIIQNKTDAIINLTIESLFLYMLNEQTQEAVA
jgi:hypothetical protein